MPPLLWVIVTWIFLSAIALDGKCPTDEEVAARAKEATEMAPIAIEHNSLAEDIYKIVETSEEINKTEPEEKFKPLLQLGKDIGALVENQIEIANPKDEPLPGQKPVKCPPPDPTKIPEIKTMCEALLPAIRQMSTMVKTNFTRLERTVDTAIADIEHHNIHLYWQQNVYAPMKRLRDSANYLLKYNFTTGSEGMAKYCGDTNGSPYGIATYMWTIFGKGCGPERNTTTTLIGEYCDPGSPYFKKPCLEVPDSCYARTYIENSGYSHDTADKLFNMATGTLLELTVYQAICVNFTHKTPELINHSNTLFVDQVLEIMREMPQIIRKEIESYWPHAAEEVIKNVASQYKDLERVANHARDALNSKFFWYKHQILAARHVREHLVGDLQWMKVKVGGDNATIYASHYRFVTDEDKASLKTRAEAHKKWLGSHMTGNWSTLTVKEFITKITSEEQRDWSWDLRYALSFQAGGEMQTSRMSSGVNLWIEKGFNVYIAGGNDCGPSCYEGFYFCQPNTVFLFISDHF